MSSDPLLNGLADQSLPAELVLQIMEYLVVSEHAIFEPTIESLSSVRKDILGNSPAAQALEPTFLAAALKIARFRIDFRDWLSESATYIPSVLGNLPQGIHHLEIAIYTHSAAMTQTYRLTQAITMLGISHPGLETLRLQMTFQGTSCPLNAHHLPWPKIVVDREDTGRASGTFSQAITDLLRVMRAPPTPTRTILQAFCACQDDEGMALAEVELIGSMTDDEIIQAMFTLPAEKKGELDGGWV